MFSGIPLGRQQNQLHGCQSNGSAGPALIVKIEGVLQSSASVRVSSMQQFAVMQQLGMLNFSRTPWDPIPASATGTIQFAFLFFFSVSFYSDMCFDFFLAFLNCSLFVQNRALVGLYWFG